MAEHARVVSSQEDPLAATESGIIVPKGDLEDRILTSVVSAVLLEQEYGLRVLINITLESAHQAVVFKRIGVDPIRALMSSDSEVVQMLAAWLLAHLSLNQDNSKAVLESYVTESLIPLLKTSDNKDVLEKALWVVNNLSLNHSHSHILAAKPIVRPKASEDDPDPPNEGWGIIPVLSDMLLSQHPMVVAAAARPLVNLMHKDRCSSYATNQTIFVEAGAAPGQYAGIKKVVSILTRVYPPPPDDVILTLTSLLQVLSIYEDKYRLAIASSGVLSTLTGIISNPDTSEIAKVQALKVLFNLSLTPQTETIILESNGVIPLVLLMGTSYATHAMKRMALNTLAQLLGSDAVQAHLRASSLAKTLTEFLVEKAIPPATAEMIESTAVIIANAAADEYLREELVLAGTVPHILKLTNDVNPQIAEAAAIALSNLEIPVPDNIKADVATESSRPSLTRTLSTSEALGSHKEPLTIPGVTIMPIQGLPAPAIVPTPAPVMVAETPSFGAPVTVSRRERVIQELLRTEQTYVQNLALCISVFLTPLVQTTRNPPLLDATKIGQIFLNIQDIYQVHAPFLQELVAQLEKLSTFESFPIGSVLQQFFSEPELAKAYSYYTFHFDAADVVLHEQIERNILFSKYLEKCSEHEHCGRLGLSSFLIQPIQRIPRYILLTNELLKNTPSSHPDHSSLQQALSTIKGVATILNEAKREAEHETKKALFKRTLVGLPVEYDLTSRKLYLEGQLVLLGRTSSSFQQFILLNDVLLVAQKEKRKDALKFSKAIPLNSANIQDLPKDETGQNNFIIAYKKNKRDKQLKVGTPRAPEKEEWMKCIMERILALNR
eukprot:TRINITY_DN2547_c0_g1_i6.p1 TRINITY_DN2547_c0_g1~~TRINITY_DN2547_c0_g1_i6.p1  ORF type:complete len:893 (+),score=272.87 TRINITY_DN2547_c0_g1_i6:173-2680(+)